MHCGTGNNESELDFVKDDLLSKQALKKTSNEIVTVKPSKDTSHNLVICACDAVYTSMAELSQEIKYIKQEIK